MADFLDRTLEMVWTQGWDDKPPLEPDYLWTVGSKGFGEEDERSIRSADDVDDFRMRLVELCRALREEAELNSLGHAMAYGQITSAIRKRHALGRMWRKRPELTGAKIAPPIVVVGQMRSGTTRVQRLLAADPQFSGTRFCNSHDPVSAIPDLRPLKARFALAVARMINPWIDTMHPLGATRTDEEIGWLSANLLPAAFEAQWRIPSFIAFSEKRDPAPVYNEFARILRSDAVAMGDTDRPRVLKCPQYAEDLPSLLGQFPDARVVFCTRDETQVLASSLSLVASQMALQSDRKDFEALDAEWRRKIALRAERMERASVGPGIKAASVRFDELNDDPVTAVYRIYRQLGLDFATHSRRGVDTELRRASRDAHSKHKYQIESFAQ